jgi:hypothetical protein
VSHLSPTTLTADEQRLILRATAGNVRDHTLISLALGTGLRLAEIVGLDVLPYSSSPLPDCLTCPPTRRAAAADHLLVHVHPAEMRSRLSQGWTSRAATGGRPGCPMESWIPDDANGIVSVRAIHRASEAFTVRRAAQRLLGWLPLD